MKLYKNKRKNKNMINIRGYQFCQECEEYVPYADYSWEECMCFRCVEESETEDSRCQDMRDDLQDGILTQ
jgi:hypothetical protein